MENKKEITLNEKVVDGIANYLGSRLGVYGIKSYDFTVSRTSNRQGKHIFEQHLDTKIALGIFRHALQACTFQAVVYKQDREEGQTYDVYSVHTHLTYIHIGCGSNGCEMDIKFYCNDRGEITESYR